MSPVQNLSNSTSLIASSSVSTASGTESHARRVRYREEEESGDGVDSYSDSAQVSGLVAVAAPASSSVLESTSPATSFRDSFLAPPPAKRSRLSPKSPFTPLNVTDSHPDMPQMISDPVADGPVAVHASNGTRRRRSHTDAMDYIPDYSHFDHESTTEPSTGTLTFKPLWAGSHIDRRELVRLAMQAFEEMGYQ